MLLKDEEIEKNKKIIHDIAIKEIVKITLKANLLEPKNKDFFRKISTNMSKRIDLIENTYSLDKYIDKDKMRLIIRNQMETAFLEELLNKHKDENDNTKKKIKSVIIPEKYDDEISLNSNPKIKILSSEISRAHFLYYSIHKQLNGCMLNIKALDNSLKEKINEVLEEKFTDNAKSKVKLIDEIENIVYLQVCEDFKEQSPENYEKAKKVLERKLRGKIVPKKEEKEDMEH